MFKIKSKIAGAVIAALAGLALILAFPFLLIFGLKLLGLPVDVSIKSYLGSLLIFFFLKMSTQYQNK